jgi:hypothetical protein
MLQSCVALIGVMPTFVSPMPAICSARVVECDLHGDACRREVADFSFELQIRASTSRRGNGILISVRSPRVECGRE